MIYLKEPSTEGKYYALASPVYVHRQSNGLVVRIDSPAAAQGIVSPDGSQIWQLAGRPTLGEGYAVVEEITMAEYDEWASLQNQPEPPDPEDTDPVIPEDTDPETVLTRAELTEKVGELDEALQMLLSGVTEDG